MTGDAVTIRPLEGIAEYRACLELQRAVWGADFSETVPPAMLMAGQKVGGVTSGAFDGERLIGFVFGITGIRDGRPTHWSDMLAVLPEYRRAGIGWRLKLHQRAILLERGVEWVLWTFDPLESGNARLNLHRLGAIARTYHRDLYGETDSPLHAGIGTDRLVAEWPIASDRVARRLARDGGSRGADAAAAGESAAGDEGGARYVVVPRSIQSLKAADPEAARSWRTRVREGLEAAFADGYVAVDVEPDPASSDRRYVLKRGFTL